jgi:hypothetical protein
MSDLIYGVKNLLCNQELPSNINCWYFFMFKCNLAYHFHMFYKSRLQGRQISRISTYMHFVIASQVLLHAIVCCNSKAKWLRWLLFITNDYVSSEDKKKCIEIPVACELLNLVLGLQFRPQVDKLSNYLKAMDSTFLCGSTHPFFMKTRCLIDMLYLDCVSVPKWLQGDKHGSVDGIYAVL